MFSVFSGYEPKTIQRPYYIYEKMGNNYVITCNDEILRTIIPEEYQDTQGKLNDSNTLPAMF